MAKKSAKRTEAFQLKKFLRSPVNQVFMAIALFCVTAVLVSDKSVAQWERELFLFVSGWPTFLHPFFITVTQLGGILALVVLAILFLLRKHYSLVIHLLMSGTLAYLIAGVAKDLLGRGRPHEFFPDLVYLDPFIRGPGFPSGHTALGAAIGISLWYYLPKRLKWLTPAIVVSVAISRMYLGVHLPLDVVGGFAIGWGSAVLFRNVRFIDIRRQRSMKT